MAKKRFSRVKGRCFFEAVLSGVIFITGCSPVKVQTNLHQDVIKDKNEPYKITIMNQSFSNYPMGKESPVKKVLEEYTNTTLEFTWVPSDTYTNRLNVMLSSDELPMVVFVSDKIPVIVNAVRSGQFWELGPYLKYYNNLSQANVNVLNNISIDGKVYSLYRSRAYGRNGIVYRKDWLDNLGLTEPKTIEEFYEVLKAFTLKDPDRNGKEDTYGMAVTSFKGPFDIMLTWFGAPNSWGEDTGGKLVPAHLTKEYMDCLRFWRKLYVEKLINSDFPFLNPNLWSDQIINGLAGVIVDVADRANGISKNMEKKHPDAVIDVLGAVSGPKGYRNLSTLGYNGMFMIPKQNVKSEEDLKKVLSFMDKLNDKKSQDLLWNGIEGRHYTLENGYKKSIIDGNIQPDEFKNLPQMLMGIPEYRYYIQEPSPIQIKVDMVQKDNEKFCVPNPAESLVSNTYILKAQLLEAIIEDARIKFILGQIDEAGFQAAMELWKNNGGNDVIKEINNEYTRLRKN